MLNFSLLVVPLQDFTLLSHPFFLSLHILSKLVITSEILCLQNGTVLGHSKLLLEGGWGGTQTKQIYFSHLGDWLLSHAKPYVRTHFQRGYILIVISQSSIIYLVFCTFSFYWSTYYKKITCQSFYFKLSFLINQCVFLKQFETNILFVCFSFFFFFIYIYNLFIKKKKKKERHFALATRWNIISLNKNIYFLRKHLCT